MSTRDPWYSPFKEAARWGAHISGHLVVLLVLISGTTFVHHLVVVWGDPKLYDLVPLRYILDTIDVGLLAAFLVYGTITTFVVFRGKRRSE